MASEGIGRYLRCAAIWTGLIEHLTKLTLVLSPKRDQREDLQTLPALLALRELNIEVEPWNANPSASFDPEAPAHIVLGGRLALTLPHLVSFHLRGLAHGDLILSCPLLAELELLATRFLRIVVEDAALVNLSLVNCVRVDLVNNTHEDHFPGIQSLVVTNSSEVGKLLIEGVGQMTHLQQLTYKYFPATCMPRSFPQGLRHLQLYPCGWTSSGGSLPEGLEGFSQLKSFIFGTDCMYWWTTRTFFQLKERLPINSLERLDLIATHILTA